MEATNPNKTTVQKKFYPSNERGHVNFGWLDSHHSFSFGHWYHPEKTNFGALRVLNDDIVEPSMGFGTHPHQNMEIVSIPLFGELAHKDSTGTNGIIKTGDVQIMSAGSGIQHSEFNHSSEKKVNFLQIWILPKVANIQPRYDQKSFQEAGRVNRFQTVVSPIDEEAVWINQDAYFSLATLEPNHTLSYKVHAPNQGIYVFLIHGKLTAEGTTLERRDAVGLWGIDEYHFEASVKSEFLVIEIPMK
ncbi:pirin family protein [Leptospira yanagawae serovar Saopaulo str. Sao Paulo = ATCC 700523]|uniref:Pirin family protein n=1 Tax=Leptospira yanagawae serovar Saopaulo str. Sao Paulo = ATCC 700523 TaxID=1249483 RepID=A0A5E8H6W2_9LEPT|nr:pirin family protein [Leptospira yanagawae]EOQ86879.1 pirin family protein [Leptospira yanagawae serovar Saopaulo str. Sao Paulo = ATCC 700523]